MNRTAATFILGASLAGCVGAVPTWDGTGTVTDLRYDDPDEWTTPGMCIDRDKNGACLSQMPDERHHDPAHWYVQVTERDGTDHLVEVNSTYGHCRIGSPFTIDRCPA